MVRWEGVVRGDVEMSALMRGGMGSFGKMAALKKGILLDSSELQLVTLHLLSQHPSHGYEVIKSVGKLTSGVYAPSPGMVYPALKYIEAVGHAVSEMEGEKKLFCITEKGSTFLNANRGQLNQVLSRIDFVGRKMSFMQMHMAQDQIADEHWGATDKENSEFYDLRHEFKSALFEKLNAQPEEKARVIQIIREAINKIRSK
jgi:DNA-binding PadR family transcriptional regulator